MIGFIKYKLFKWLLYNICNVGDCCECGFGSTSDIDICPKCGAYTNLCCSDILKRILEQARKVWKVE